MINAKRGSYIVSREVWRYLEEPEELNPSSVKLDLERDEPRARLAEHRVNQTMIKMVMTSTSVMRSMTKMNVGELKSAAR